MPSRRTGWDAQWLFMFRYHSGTLSGNLYCTAAEPHTVMQRQIASKIKAIRNALLRLQIENSSHGDPCRRRSPWPSLIMMPGKPKEDPKTQTRKHPDNQTEKAPKPVYLVDEEYLVTALVPSETACLASSPGRMRRTDVWISRDEMVDFLL